MKYLIIYLLLLLSPVLVSSQTFKDHTISVSYYGFATSEILTNLTGAASVSGQKTHIFGLNYFHRVNKWIEFESGVEFGKHRFLISPNIPPGSPILPHEVDSEMLTIPAGFRMSYKGFFYFNAACLIDFNLSGTKGTNTDQSGVGIMAGIGIKYALFNKIAVFINPNLRLHNISKFRNNDRRLLEGSIRFGLGYSF